MEDYLNVSKAAELLKITDDEFMYILTKYKRDIHIKYIYEEDKMIEKSWNGEFDSILGKGFRIDKATFWAIFNLDCFNKSIFTSLLQINISDFKKLKLKFDNKMIDNEYMKNIIKYYIEIYYNDDEEKKNSYKLKTCVNPFTIYSTLNKYKDKYDNNMNLKISFLISQFNKTFGDALKIKSNIGHQGSVKDNIRIKETEEICILINEDIKKYNPKDIKLTHEIYKREVENNCINRPHNKTIATYWGKISSSYKYNGRLTKEDSCKPEYIYKA